jgi:polyribonucleotide nucleotidyltransferase
VGENIAATATLGTSREANQIDSPSEQGEEKFYTL